MSDPTDDEVSHAFSVLERFFASRRTHQEPRVSERDPASLLSAGVTARELADNCRAGKIKNALRTTTSGWSAPVSAVEDFLRARQERHRRTDQANDVEPSNAALLAAAGGAPTRRRPR